MILSFSPTYFLKFGASFSLKSVTKASFAGKKRFLGYFSKATYHLEEGAVISLKAATKASLTGKKL